MTVRNPREALIEGDVDGAVDWLRQHMRGAVCNNHSLADLALRLNGALGDIFDDDPAIASLLKAPGYQFFAAGQVVRRRLKKGEHVRAAIAALPAELVQKYQKSILESFEAFHPDRPLRPSRHIAICGVSYCGSTLVDRIIGSTDGVESIGESIFLSHYHDPSGNVPIAPNAFDSCRARYCTTCGPDCRLLTDTFRTALLYNPINWFAQIADRFDTSGLLSSDKNLTKLIRHDPLSRYDAIVLFKSPQHAWFSKRSRLGSTLSNKRQRDELERFLQVWQRSYTDLLYRFKPKGQKLFIDFDAFTRRPEETLIPAMTRLGIEMHAEPFKRAKPSHAVGGNSNANIRFAERNHSLDIQPRLSMHLPPDHIDRIVNDIALTKLYDELRQAARR